MKARAETESQRDTDYALAWQNFKAERGGIAHMVLGCCMAHCSCGGRGPDDAPCQACEVWHTFLDGLTAAANAGGAA